jgi:hypothetical protein
MNVVLAKQRQSKYACIPNILTRSVYSYDSPKVLLQHGCHGAKDLAVEAVQQGQSVTPVFTCLQALAFHHKGYTHTYWHEA